VKKKQAKKKILSKMNEGNECPKLGIKSQEEEKIE